MARWLILLLAGLKYSKLMLSVGSMLLSIAVYAQYYGWRYAAGFVGLIFVHEMGHYVAARQRGLKVGLPTFIPFMGAWIQLKELPHDAETEAYVGLAGPLIGSVGALACYFAARQGGDSTTWLLAVSYAGFFLNLFNLIPVSPLDGGRITAVLSPRIWLLGAPVLVAVLVTQRAWVLLIILVLAMPQLQAAWRFDRNDPENQRYYAASLETRLSYSITYFALLVFLAVMTHDLHATLGR